MSIEAELVTALGRLQTVVAATQTKVDGLGTTLERGMQRGGRAVEQVSASTERLGRRAEAVGRSLLGALGIGSAGAALMTVVGAIQRMQDKAIEERRQSDEGVRATRGIFADSPAFRAELDDALPGVERPQQAAFARAFLGRAGREARSDLGDAGRLATLASRITGISLEDLGRLLGTGRAAGLRHTELSNFLGAALSRYGSTDLRTAETLPPQQIRSMGRQAFAFREFQRESVLSRDDLLELSRSLGLDGDQRVRVLGLLNRARSLSSPSSPVFGSQFARDQLWDLEAQLRSILGLGADIRLQPFGQEAERPTRVIVERQPTPLSISQDAL